ncbi:MAG: FadR/GntR family transcriptional regulator [Bacillota bacterium]
MARELRVPRLYELVVNQICDWIVKGQVRPGDKFPSERELEAKLGVSRAVLREAFHLLESRGLIYSRHGRGRFVRDLEGSEVEAWLGTPHILRKLEKASLLDVYEVRMDLESEGLELVAKRASEAELAEIVELFGRSLVDWKRAGISGTDFELHTAYAEASHNFMWEQLIKLEIRLVAEFSAPEFSRLILDHRVEDYVNDHGAVVRALKARDGARAAKAMRTHINRTIRMLKAV